MFFWFTPTLSEITCDLDISNVELTKVYNNGQIQSSVLNDLERKYKYVLESRLKETNKKNKRLLIEDDISSFIIENQDLDDFIPGGMKPAR